ncbi:MAG TPA: FYDLN acid domain-containing protein [Myxococcaceae bacterium]|nr:FYDLN acid domain-containing protein [Myxococcaceae bacterium]
MPAKDLGNKFTCFKCTTKFYDMKKPDPLCPKCGADQRESPALKPQPEGRRGRLASVPKVIEPLEVEEPEAAASEEEEEVESFEDDEEAEPAVGGDDDDI